LVIDPTGALDAEPLKEVAEPGEAGVTLNDAVGAWSGVIAMPNGLEPTGMAVPAVLVEIVIGVTLADM
jgi:hypothetical protein